MKLFWTLKSIPELTCLSQLERRQAWQECYWKFLRHWPGSLTLLITPICVVVGCAIGDWLISNEILLSEIDGHPNGDRPSRIPLYISAAIGGGIGGTIFCLTVRHQIRPRLKAFLGDSKRA